MTTVDGVKHPDDDSEARKRFSKPWLLKRASMDRINWLLPGADREGFRRGMHNGVQAQRSFAKLVTMPAGQRTPVHSVSADHIIFQVRGEVEFNLAEQSFLLQEHDLFFFPADAPYWFRNVGTGDAEFLSLVVQATKSWPPGSTYHIDGETVSYTV